MVVVVGNLTVGGTGKTPVVERFAKELIKKNRKWLFLAGDIKANKNLKLET